MRIPIPTAPGRALAGNAGHLPPTFQLPFKPAPAGKQAFTPPPAPNGTAIEDAESTPEPAATPAELYELALTSAAMGFHQTAIDRLREATQRAPDHAAAWRKLAELVFLAGLDEESEAARAAADRVGDDAGKWPRATGERSPTKIEKAERKLHEILRRVPAGKEPTHLRNRLFRDPTDVAAMRLLALHEWRDDDQITAQSLLERALDLSPGYTRARSDLASLLNERRNFVRALAEADRLLASTPRDQEYRAIRADALVQIGRFAEAIEIFEGMLKVHPRNAKYWVAYGNSLHYIGRRDDSVAAYRNCLALAPTTGEAYWGLADLKGKFVTEADVAAMRVHLAGKDLDLASRWHMSYALGHALERAGDFAGSFAAYQDGAQAFREHVASTSKAHSPDTATDRVRRLRKVFSAEHIAARATPAASPAPRDTPIFVVGMPRAGSTLVEQILASHSMVEGTRELPLMGDITRELTMSRCLVIPAAYPERVLELKPHELAALGERYIRNSSVYRHTDRPFFVDKRPWNWQDAGLIRLIMPHAKIIDVRREPMAACFAMFKQLLPVDASFSYDLTEVGRYYNEYVDMMQHWETALPGHIHYLSYERLVEDTETEIRRMLEYCGLPFEEGCLRFWETDRAVLTPSAEQVRRPIFRDALQQWRNYEPWLDPLKAALATPVEAWFK